MENTTAATLKRAPHARPPFTLSQIKKAIPPHCFNRSLLTSFSYLIFDLSIAAVFYYAATTFITPLPTPLAAIAWPAYWFLQGCVLTGVWVVAHECGHQAFSDYGWLNDTLGFVLHSCLFVPYFSWKHSHRRHHANHSSLENDEAFVPKQKSTVRLSSKYLKTNPLGRAIIAIITLTLGFPSYLAFNISGRNYGIFTSHFDPYCPIYSDRERAQIFFSDAGILAVCYAVYRVAIVRGLAWVAKIYFGPVVVVNAYVVLITFLHHTHPSLPHYDSSEWEWLRGAISTMDRSFGAVLDKVLHNISDTHVTHHLFSSIPHYHAKEATEAIKPVLGEYYQFDPTPVYKAMFREIKECVFVEPDKGSTAEKGVFWFKNSDVIVKKRE